MGLLGVIQAIGPRIGSGLPSFQLKNDRSGLKKEAMNPGNIFLCSLGSFVANSPRRFLIFWLFIVRWLHVAVFPRVVSGENNDAHEHHGGHDYGDGGKEKDHDRILCVAGLAEAGSAFAKAWRARRRTGQ